MLKQLELLFQLFVLFFVIFDPFLSFSVFLTSTKDMSSKEKLKTGALSVMVAAIISYSFLIFGTGILKLFNLEINDFRVAGGIILCILGIKMSLGQRITQLDENKQNSSRAIAAIIGTPLLTGPAAITTIIISVNDYNMLITGIAITLVLLITSLLFLIASLMRRFLGLTTIQVISTILGLITISWGVNFIKVGLQTYLKEFIK
jgi:multiple antibiotic resistance protein